MDLTNLNNYYTTQIKRTKLSGNLKLSEVITIKNLLRTKFHKEIQGFRTASADYADLDKVNAKEVELIIFCVLKLL